MCALRTSTWRAATALAGMGLVLVVGCGDSSGLAKRYPVSGTVTYKGQPVEKGTVNFIPAAPDKGREATGSISNGRFRLTTSTPDDGAMPGQYKVTVQAQEVDTTELHAISKGGQHHHDDKFAKAVMTA